MGPLIYLRTENLAKMSVSLTRRLGKQKKLPKTNLVSKNIHKTSSFLRRQIYDRPGVAFEYRNISFTFRNFFARNRNLFGYRVIATNSASHKRWVFVRADRQIAGSMIFEKIIGFGKGKSQLCNVFMVFKMVQQL